MTPVVVTGATGFVGRRVCVRLAAAGLAVTAVTRDARTADPSGIAGRVVIGDIGPTTDWRPAVRAGDTLVHLAARAHQGDDAQARADFQRINVDGTRGLIEAAVAARVAHVVFVSSAKVFGERSPVEPDGKPHAFTASDETFAVGPYGESKIAAENVLRARCGEAGIALTILRPPLIYGPGNKANLLSLLRAIDRGWPLPLASIRNRRSLVYVDNLADAIARAIATPGGIRCYTVCDVDLATPDLVRALAAGLGREARLLPCPVALLRAFGRFAGRPEAIARLTESMVIDRTQIARALDWRPACDLAHAMRATGQWSLENAACR